jgi:drug/metabolite transporter (DMT)-like permease
MSLVFGFTTTTTTTTSTTNTFNSAAAAAEAAGEEAFSTRNVGYLILSSTLGIIIGDVLWLQALLILGAKQVIVIDSLRPFCAALLGRVVLNETLGLAAWGGMVLTVGGVVIVAIEDGRRNTTTTKKKKTTTDVTTMNVSMGNFDSVLHRENGVTVAEDANCVNKKEDVEQQESSITSAINNDEKGLNVNVAIDTRTRTDETARTIVTDINSTIYNNNDDEILHKNNESSENVEQKNQRNLNRIGYACAFINVFADSFGSLLQKRHGTGMTTWSINLIRFGFGGFILCVISVLMRIRDRWSIRRKWIVADKSSKKSSIISSAKGRLRGYSMEQQQQQQQEISISVVVPSCQPPPRWYELPTLTKKGWLQINAGVALVTFFSPALWNFALLRIALGLAVALGSVGPVYGLILDWPFKGQIPTLVGLIGVLLTVVGVVILCIWGT